MWLVIAVVLASPVADAHPHLGSLVALFVPIIILIGASFAGNKKIMVMVAIPIAGLWMVARLVEEFSNGLRVYDHLGHVAGFALSCTLFWALFGRLGTVSKITST